MAPGSTAKIKVYKVTPQGDRSQAFRTYGKNRWIESVVLFIHGKLGLFAKEA